MANEKHDDDAKDKDKAKARHDDAKPKGDANAPEPIATHDRTVHGGAYISGGRVVDANGEPVEGLDVQDGRIVVRDGFAVRDGRVVPDKS